MKKIEKRALLCLLLAAALLLGSGLFVFRFVKNGGRWVSFAANRHLYNRQGQLSVRPGAGPGRGRALLDGGGRHPRAGTTTPPCARPPSTPWGTPKATSAPGRWWPLPDQLSGYNLLTGAYSPLGAGNDLYLTLDARYNYDRL